MTEPHDKGRLDRRAFLGRVAGGTAAVLAGPAVLAACSSGSTGSAAGGGAGGTTLAGGTGTTAGTLLAQARGGSMLDLPASQSPIKHVVVLMMENRSFDHWLGWLASDERWLEAGKRAWGGDFTIAGNQDQTFDGADGPVRTRHLIEQLQGENPYRGCGHPDPGHSWDKGRAQRDGGFLATGSGNDPFATGFYLADDLPFTAQLARRFTVFDHSFASVLGPTFPNREYLLSAQSGGNKTNALPDLTKGFAWDTIYDRLLKAGVTVRNYYVDLPVAGLWGPRLISSTAKIDQFFADCTAGTLPQVSFVDPGFTGGARTDNHPHGDIRAGEKYVRDAFAAFAASKHWAEGAFFLTYDEWGGFFDHVKPPVLPDERTSADDKENFGQAGFRVPTIAASPFARINHVDTRQYDHTSILRFLEWRFLGAPPEGNGGAADWSLTQRDRNANNIGASFVVEPVTEVGIDTAVAIDPASADCAGPAEGLAFDPSDPRQAPQVELLGDKHSMEEAMDAGYFESVGIDGTPSSMARAWVD